TIPAYRTYAVIPFPATTKADCPYYTELKLVLNYSFGGSSANSTVFDVTTTTLRDGIDLGGEFELIRLLLEKATVASAGLTFYWEQFDDIYRPNSIIAVRNGSAPASFTSLQFTADTVTGNESDRI